MKTHVFGRPVMFTRPLVFATAFMSFFSVVIALFKMVNSVYTQSKAKHSTPIHRRSSIVWVQDIPDIEGKESDHSLRFRHVFHYLQMAYAVAVLVGATSPFIWSKVISVTIFLYPSNCNQLCHVLLATTLWTRAKSVDLSSKTEITSMNIIEKKEEVITILIQDHEIR
ncbi:hypothetical protein HID58_032586 [Brassica napus]|uniref:Uncharacterized protein n=1 Tax=Brassica napus TaxID=3708 RepID=A0ABQ8BYC3_BRANA|nr:hypothetical protein HID58_032586 [Brassica napus]